MRLSKHEQAVILTNVHKYIAADAQVWLFGSRCDDNKAGGDIDLYIESDPISKPLESRIYLKIALQDELGYQKFDLVYHDRSLELQPIHQIAKAEGIELVPL